MKTVATQLQGLQMTKFLQEYWQKRPCVIKQFIPDLTDPIDEHDLAGLAQEGDVDSRLISCVDDKWQVTQGPIDDFKSLCVGAWTLLVQGVDRHVPEVDALSDIVKQIGNWRMDDVMVSFSVVGAGVGPHVDQYDVFIVQGKGSRRWQVGLPCQCETLLPHPLLKQISEFPTVINEILEAGDAIYIPPQHPHNGVALTDCMNYSIGFRAPTNLEVLNGFLDEAEGLALAQQRYSDPDIFAFRDENLSNAIVTSAEIERLRIGMISLLNSEQAEQSLLQSISRQSLPDMRPEKPYLANEVLTCLQNNRALVKAPGVKPIYAQNKKTDFKFYIDGQAYIASPALTEFAISLVNLPITHAMQFVATADMEECACLVTSLLNEGHIEFG